jgi:hypothetical protein
MSLEVVTLVRRPNQGLVRETVKISGTFPADLQNFADGGGRNGIALSAVKAD